MADIIKKFKPLTSDDIFKGASKTYSAVKYAYGDGQDAGATEALQWYFVERGAEDWSTLTDDLKNLFHSFGISREDENDWFRAFNLVDYYNAKRMLIASIPQSGCASYIDGSTVKLNVPVGSGATEFVTFYGSSFKGYTDPSTNYDISVEYEDIVYGCASCYLFADTNNPLSSGSLPSNTYASGKHHPYTGNVNGNVHQNSGRTSWDTDNETQSTWALAGAKMTPHLRATHFGRMPDDGKDVPYGVAMLEQGLFIIFDMYGRTDFLDNTNIASGGSAIWSSTTNAAFITRNMSGGTAINNVDSDFRKQIVFTGTTAHENAKLTYRTVDQAYKMIYFCHAGQGEFNSTSNHTYDHKKAYFRPEEADSLWISEIGLYDEDDNMLAIAKLSEPVEKNKLETLTFKVELQL